MVKKLALVGVGIVGLVFLVSLVGGGGGTSFTTKVKGGSSVTVGYKAISEYVSMEANGEAANVGSRISIPVKCMVQKPFSSICVSNKNAAENSGYVIRGGKKGDTTECKILLPRNEFMDEVELDVVTISE